MTIEVRDWINRINHTLEVQKDISVDNVSMNFHRAELKALLNILKLADGHEKEIEKGHQA